MTRLLRVELARFLWRRAVLVLLAVAIVIPVVIGIGTMRSTAPPGEDEVAEAERMIAANPESRWAQRNLERCLEHPRRYGVESDADDLGPACEEATQPGIEGYLEWEPLDLVEERQNGSGIAVVVILAILMMLAGTTFAGHDWASGSVSNQLLFEPRRLRVWAAKAVVVTVAAFAVAAVVLASYWLALGWLARSRDIEVPSGVLLDSLQMGWRGAAVAAAAAFGGYALTMLFRSTVAALGILLALGLAGGLILAAIGVGSIWNPGLNMLAVVLDGATYWENGPCPGSEGFADSCSVERTLSLPRGVGYLGVLLAAGAAASLVSFGRRDVG